MEWSQFFVCMSLHLNGTWQCNVIILKWTFFQACNSITFWQHYTLYWTGVLPHTVICHQFAFVTMEPSQQDNWKRKSALFFFNFLNSLDAAEVSIIIKEEIKDNLGWIPESQPCQLWKTAFLSLMAAKTKYVVKNTYGSTVNVLTKKHNFLSIFL